jgi:hypothetical protein
MHTHQTDPTQYIDANGSRVDAPVRAVIHRLTLSRFSSLSI